MGWIISERCDLSFNQKNIIMVLFLIYCQDDELRNICKSFLLKKKGKWLDLEKGNIFSNQKLIYQITILAKENQDLFTLEEHSFFDSFRFIYTIKNNMKTLLLFMVIEPLYLRKGTYQRYEINDCYEQTCMFCDQVRDLSSFSKITDEDMMCIVCLCSDEKDDDQFRHPRNVLLQNAVKACCRNCNCHYVINTKYTDNNPLNPLCHFCKNNENTSFLTCIKCQKRDIIDTFVSTKLGFNEETYMCKTCAPNKSLSLKKERHSLNKECMFEGKNKLNYNLPKVNVKFLDFFILNRNILFSDNVENSDIYQNILDMFISKTSIDLTRNKDSNKYKDIFEKLKLHFTNDQFKNIKLYYNGYQIYDSYNVLMQFLDNITKENTVFECSFCFNQFLPVDGKVCEKCSNSICESCFRKSTKLPSRGELINQSDVCCTICKTPHAILSNKVKIENMIPNIKEYKFEGRYHVQCKDCSCLYRLNVEGGCGVEIDFTIRNWSCEKCISSKEKIEMNNGKNREESFIKKQKKCPTCNQGVEKNGGCNHITCLCGTHFCYICQEEIDSLDPYEHFQTSNCNLYD